MTDLKRSPKKRKSTRRLCPLDIDCELVAAERGKVCPNRDYCEHVAAPWVLPYRQYFLSDETKVLMVDNCGRHKPKGTPDHEKYKAGWDSAETIPFKYIRIPDFSKPILLVLFEPEINSGWAEAKPLGERYEMWAACQLGISYPEFYKKHFDHGLYYYYGFETLIDPQSKNPHCILPPNF